jgi:murein DD-endopeptidase MepM/ murein hydrolase activator NlpD
MLRVSPILPLIVGNNGAYAHVRSSPAQGSCGTKGYPCKHPGTDLNGRAGTVVRSPEAGVVALAADGSASPFKGYGPWLVLIKGDSGKYHLLAHLDPAQRFIAPIGKRVAAGATVGVTSSANHTHWEVRTKLVPDFARGEDNFTNNTDPVAWLSGGGGIGVMGGLLAIGGGILYYLWRRS